MARRYLVLSDLHLCDIENHPDGWKDYKHSRFVFDQAIDVELQRFAAEAADGDELTLILGGDIFDFDLVCSVPDEPPFPVSRRERKHGLESTEAKSVWKLQRVLVDHPLFLASLARFADRGHTVVYVAGNHDPEVNFPAVRQALLDAIATRAAALGLGFDSERVRIEPWFYCAPGDIYVEHGHQYDYYNSFRYILAPTVPGDPQRIALPTGNLSNRLLMSQMGFFNPHSADYILNIFAYIAHWLRYYAFSRHRLIYNWLVGSILVLVRLLRTKKELLLHPPDYPALLARQATRAGLPLEEVERLDALKRLPISSRFYRLVREFWIDRVLLALVMAGGTLALALVPVPLWIKLMVPLTALPLLFLIYEWFAHGESIFSVEAEIHKYAFEIAKIVSTRVVAFGHTHSPRSTPLLPGVTYVNTGTWAPVPLPGRKGARGPAEQTLQPGLRNALFVAVDGDHVEMRLDTCLSLHDAPAPAATSRSAASRNQPPDRACRQPPDPSIPAA